MGGRLPVGFANAYYANTNNVTVAQTKEGCNIRPVTTISYMMVVEFLMLTETTTTTTPKTRAATS